MSSPPEGVDVLVKSLFTVKDSYELPEGESEYRVEYREDSKRNFEKLHQALASKGLSPWLTGSRDDCVLMVRKRQAPQASTSRIPVIMILLTVVSVSLFTYIYLAIYSTFAPAVSDSWVVLGYAGGVVLILAAHELGHRLVARRQGGRPLASYVIPGVPYITFILPSLGLISTPREPSVNRDRFFDLIAAGPLAGFAAAVALGILGQLTLVPSTLKATGTQTVLSVISVQPLNPSVIQVAISEGLARFAPSVPSGYLPISPLADSAGVGLLLTFASLLPLAFFDGGALCTTVFGSRVSKVATYLGVLALIIIDAPSYWALAIIVLLMVGRPLSSPVLDEVSGVSTAKKAALFVAIAIAIACLPIPAVLATIR